MILSLRAPARRRRAVSWWRAACLGSAIASGAGGAAHAQLIVSPLRAVITRDAREATIEVSNPSDRIVTARADWIDLAAGIDGYIEADAEARQHLSAAPMLSLEPASIRLEPGARRRVRLRLRDDAKVPKGERRSHLLLSSAPSRSPLRRTSGGLRADISLSISLPVLVRGAGQIKEVRAAFEATRLDRDKAGDLLLVTDIRRTGPYSPYGALSATFDPKGGDGPIELARLDNVAAPIDAPTTRLRLPLGRDALPAGALTLVYEGRAEFDGTTFAERRFDIAPPPE